MFRRFWFRMFWKADFPGLVFLFYVPIFTLVFLFAWRIDLLPYPEFIISYSQMTDVRTAPLVESVWKWSYGILPFALSIFSFSYSSVKDVSLSLTFTANPVLRHLVVLFSGTTVMGAIQVYLNLLHTPGRDRFTGDVLHLLLFGVSVITALIYVIEQFKRLAAPDEFAYCQAKIDRFIRQGIARADITGGLDGVAHALDSIQVNVETMFQIMATLVQKDMDVMYDQFRVQVTLQSTTIVTTMQQIEKDRILLIDYNARVRFLIEKYYDHLLVLSAKNHGPETREILEACTALEKVAASHGGASCLVHCAIPLRRAVSTLIQRRDRLTLMAVLGEFHRVYMDYRSPELAAALLYIYEVVLVEASVNEDRGTLHEMLYKIQDLTATLRRTVQVQAVYRILWTAALKLIEHSSHESTGAFLKTFVARFDQNHAAAAFDYLIESYRVTGEIPVIRVPTLQRVDERTKSALTYLNPEYELIRGSLDYTLEKLLFLWYGQQHFLIATKARGHETPVLPAKVGLMSGRNLHYLSTKLREDPYGLSWVKGDLCTVVYHELCGILNVTPVETIPADGSPQVRVASTQGASITKGRRRKDGKSRHRK